MTQTVAHRRFALRRLTAGADALARMRRRPAETALLDLFGTDAETAVLIGRAYLAAGAASGRDIEALARTFEDCGTPAEALVRLRRAVRSDLARGRAFIFNGWVLAKAEAEACALFATART